MNGETPDAQTADRRRARTSGPESGVWPTGISSLYEPVLRELRGKSVVVVKPEGNVGDDFILSGMLRLFQDSGVQARLFHQRDIAAIPPCEVICWGGGGNVSGRYKRDLPVKHCATLARQFGARFVCLPQSIEHRTDRLRLFDRLFLREVTSVAMEPGALLVPDLALYHRLPPAKPELAHQQVFRADREATGRFEPNDPRAGLDLPGFIALAGRAAHLETDLLHFSIAALLQGVQVTLRPCDWHKNESMYRTWLHHFPNCRFER